MCQLKFEPGLGIVQVDQGEAVEIQPVGQRQPEGQAAEIDRARLVEHADHAVDGPGHGGPLPVARHRAASGQV